MRDPYSLEAEHGVLGAILIDPSLLDTVSSDLSADDFYWPDNAKVYKSMLDLASKQQPIDFLTVAEMVGRLENGDPATQYIIEIRQGVPSAANVMSYARVVRERSLDRRLIDISSAIHEIAHSTTETPDKIAQAQAEVLALEGSAVAADVVTAWDVLIDHMPILERREELKGDLDGLSTGLEDLDEKLQGLKPEQLIIVAGRPAMGKTTLAMNIAADVSIRQGKKVQVFSLEMANNQLMDRFLAAEGTIPLQDIKSGRGSSGENGLRLTAAAGKIRDSGLMMSDRPGLTMSRIRSIARRQKARTGLDLVVIDYLQLLDEEGGSGNRTEAVSAMSRGAKLMARELKIPVIMLSQLNRGLEQRPNKRPMCSDLRESGAIEQDADIILFVYRDEVYYPDSEYKGVAEIIIGKGRDIETGTVRAAFLGQYSQFKPLAVGWEPPTPKEPPKKTRGMQL